MQRTPRHHCFVYLSLLLLIVQIFIVPGLCKSKAWAASMIKIGVLEEPRTLNIWLASDRWSRRVLGQIYHPLFIREPKNLKLIPWLAEGYPVYDEATLSYTIKIRQAKWSDGSELTSEDVAFTGNLIKEFKIPRNYSKWKFIKKIEALDKRTVRFTLEKPNAIFLSTTLTTPIVQKKEWEKVAEDAKQAQEPLTQLLNYKIKKPVGSGPFILKEWKRGAYLLLTRNRHFFGQGKTIGGHQLGPYIDGIIFKIFGTTHTAIQALKKKSIDMFWWGIQQGYIKELRKEKNIQIFNNERSAIYYIGFNLRKRPFNDIHFRHSVATLIDKDFIIMKVLQGNVVSLHSIVPPGNTFWQSSEVPRYGDGLSREERIRKAYEILSKAGYTWKAPPVNAKGNVVKGKGILLPNGDPMETFTILTPLADYDPYRAMAGVMAQEWLRMVGIPAIAKPVGLRSLIQQVKGRHQFDLFILGYGRLSPDPDYLRSFFHSSNDTPRGWNMSGYHNPEFDRISDESSTTMDLQKRRELIWQMQKIIIEDIPYFPLYSPKLIEGVRTDTFGGWVEMLGGIGNTWSFCQIRPKLN